MNQKKPTVLVGVLDWGLGHATRSIPVVTELLKNGAGVILASAGEAGSLLRKEFPSLPYQELPGYKPYYSKGNSMVSVMLKQLPKFLEAIAAEHRQIGRLRSVYQVDGILSDNRYGLWQSGIPSVLMTHQTTLELPKHFFFPTALIRFGYRNLLRRFDAIWVPDLPGYPNLSGDLSRRYAVRNRYIGPLSRMTASKMEIKYELAVVLSGPEPQRSRLEIILAEQLSHSTVKTIFIRGKMEPSSALPKLAHVEYHDFMDSGQINTALLQSEQIICRSGYSTIMDLVKLGKPAILVPTPGQTEQEYLAKYLMDEKMFFAASQSEFQLGVAMSRMSELKYRPVLPEYEGLLPHAVDDLITKIGRMDALARY